MIEPVGLHDGINWRGELPDDKSRRYVLAQDVRGWPWLVYWDNIKDAWCMHRHGAPVKDLKRFATVD